MSEANIEGNAGSPSAAPAPAEPRHLRRVLIIWAVLSVVVIAIWLAVAQFILPSAASGLDGSDNFTFLVLTVLAVPVSLFVFVFLGYSLIVFRVKERPTEDGPPLQPRPSLQIGWLGITSLLCLFLLIWGLFAFYQETSAAAITNTLVVQVTAQQWQWTFDYPQYGATSQGAQVIELPVNRPVEFYVTSRSEEHTSELQSRLHLVCRLLLEKKKGRQTHVTPSPRTRRSPRRCWPTPRSAPSTSCSSTSDGTTSGASRRSARSSSPRSWPSSAIRTSCTWSAT